MKDFLHIMYVLTQRCVTTRMHLSVCLLAACTLRTSLLQHKTHKNQLKEFHAKA
jgi:hypothetical protein